MRWLLSAALLLSSCTALRQGWVSVDFLSAPSDVMVCSFTVDSEGDTVGKCADWNDVNEGLGALNIQQKIKRIHTEK